MGDTFSNINNSTIINEVTGEDFHRINHERETKRTDDARIADALRNYVEGRAHVWEQRYMAIDSRDIIDDLRAILKGEE